MKKVKFLDKINPLFLRPIAHRGLHNETYPENSLGAFKNAIKNNLPFEFDVHITKDLKVVVFHDDDLKRVTGKDGVIENLTFNELRHNYALPDGSLIPTLEEVLELNNEQVPMVLELKVVNKNYKKLTIETLKILKKYRINSKNLILISFDPRCFFFTKNEKYLTQLLVCKDYEWTYKYKFLANGIDIEYILLEENRVQRYRKHHVVNTWTINSKEAYENIKNQTDMITFEKLDLKDIA